MRILIVEDEAVIALDLEALVRSWGYEVTGIAATGEQALELVRARTPDLALLDVRLRGAMDGIEVGAAIQAQHNTPLIFLTAYADTATLQRAGTLHPVGYLLKPVDPPMLAATLKLGSHRRQMERERSRLQTQRQHMQALLSVIMDGCPDAMLAVDHAGHVVQLNQRACGLTGMAREEALGANLENALGLSLRDARRSGTTGTRYGTSLRRPDGEALSVEVAAAEVTFAGRSFFSLVIREKSEVEEQSRQHDRRARLEASGLLAAGIAHDLCGLLTTMKSSAFLIRDSSDPRAVEEAQQLDDAIARGSAMLGNLLGFVRSAPAQFEAVDLGAIVERLAVVLRHAVGPHAILELHVEQGVWVLGRISRLEQLLLNLVFNAREAVKAGGHVSVRVSTERVAEGKRLSRGSVQPGDYAILEVVDDGAGIAPDILPKVFEPFFSTKLERKGTGLGLITVQDVLDEHEGALDLQSELDRGTAVRAYLPLFPVEAGTIGAAESEADARAPASTLGDKQISDEV